MTNSCSQKVWEAYKLVKAKGGAAGVDGQTLEEFEEDMCVFRTNVAGRFGIVTGDFGIVTERTGRQDWHCA